MNCKSLLYRIYVVLLILPLVFIQLPSIAAPGIYELHSIDVQDLASRDAEFADFLRRRRIDRGRDPKLDLRLARALNENPFSSTVLMPLIRELEATWVFKRNQRLLEGTLLAQPDSRPKVARIHNDYQDVLADPFFHFTEKEREQARVYIQGGNTINAYSYSVLPQTIYYEGLVERMNRNELKSVMAHELGHAQNQHMYNFIGLFSVLLAGGYDFGDEDGNDLGQNMLLSSFGRNISAMAKSPGEVIENKNLNPLERAIALSLSQFSGHSSSNEYSENMTIYLESIYELTGKLMTSASKSKKLTDLQALIYNLESIIVDDEKLKKDQRLLMAKLDNQAMLMSPIREIFVDLTTYLKAVSRGVFALSRSDERSADIAAVVVMGSEVEQRSMGRLVGGSYMDIESQLRQLEIARQERESDPDRAELLDNFQTHPSANQRIYDAVEFEMSFQYKTLKDPFIKMLYDTLDVSIYVARGMHAVEEIESSSTAHVQELQNTRTLLRSHVDYVQGKLKEEPGGFSFPVGVGDENFDPRKHKGKIQEAALVHFQGRLDMVDTELGRLAKMNTVEKEILDEKIKAVKRYQDRMVKRVIDHIVSELGKGNEQILVDTIRAVNLKLADNQFVNMEFAIDHMGFVAKLLRALQTKLKYKKAQIDEISKAFNTVIDVAKDRLDIDEDVEEEKEAIYERIADVANRSNQSVDQLLRSFGYIDQEVLAVDIMNGHPNAFKYLLLQNEKFRERDGENPIEHAIKNGYNTPEELVAAVLAEYSQTPILNKTRIQIPHEEIIEIVDTALMGMMSCEQLLNES